MSRKILSLISLFAMLFAFASVNVQAEEPVAQISVGSYQSISAGFKALGKMINNQQLSVLPKLVEVQMGDDFAKSFDQKQPMGALIYKAKDVKEGKCPVSFMVFLPISNSKNILAKLGENEDSKIDEDFEFKGVKMVKFVNDEKTFYLITANGWTFLSDKAELLLKLPEKPASLLGDMPQKYLLATKINIDAIPESAKKWTLEQVESGIKAAKEEEDADNAEDTDDVSDKVADLTLKTWMDNFKRMLYEVKTVVIGFGLDTQKDTIYLDLDVTPVENSKLADQIKSYKDVKPFVNVLLDGATSYSTQVSTMEDSQAKNALQVLSWVVEDLDKAIKDDEGIKDKEKLNALIKKTSDVAEKVIKANAGKITKSGSAVFFKEDNLSFVAASEGANVDGIDALIQDWIKAYVKDADKYFKTNTETWEGLKFNVATIPTELVINGLQQALEAAIEENAAGNADDADDADDTDTTNKTNTIATAFDDETDEELEIDPEDGSDDVEVEEEEEIQVDPQQFMDEVAQTLQAVFGDKIEIAYAVGKDKFYFAIGGDAVGLIKKTVKNTKATMPNGEQSLAMIDVQEIFVTLSKFTFIPEQVRDVLDKIATSAGKENQGKVYLGAKLNENGGALLRLEVESGVLQVIQKLFLIKVEM